MKYLGEPLNGFAPNSQGRRVWSLTRTSLNVRSKVKGQETPFSANISEIAELICDKFTWKTCLVRRSDEFKGQGQFRRPACGLCLENLFALVYATLSPCRRILSNSTQLNDVDLRAPKS